MDRTRRDFLAAAGALVGAGCLGRGRNAGNGDRTTTTTTTTTTSTTETSTTATTTTTTTRPETEITPVDAVAWRRSLGADVALGPAVADGTLYAGTTDGVLHAHEPDGTERWTAELGGAYFAGSGVDRSPLAAEGTVYLTSGTQSGAHGRGFTLYALDAATGEERWSASAEYPNFFGLLGVEGGTVYAATSDDYLTDGDETLYAYDAASGEELWTVETGDPRSVGVGTDAVAVATWGSLQVVGADGTKRWTDGDFARVAPSGPRFVDGRLLVAAEGEQSGLYALDPATGGELWARTDRSVSELRVGDHAYVGGNAVASYALDGTERWATDIEAPILSALRGDTLYAGNFSGAAIALATGDGGEQWVYEADADTVLVTDADPETAAVEVGDTGIVDGVDAASGDRRFRLEGANPKAVTRPVVSGGTTYVADGATVYALE